MAFALGRRIPLQLLLVTWTVSCGLHSPWVPETLTFLGLRGGKAGETTSSNFKLLYYFFPLNLLFHYLLNKITHH